MTKKDTPCPWPEEAVAMLRKHWEDGVSASQSAKMINEAFGTTRSRNSIISKRHNLGLVRNTGPRFQNAPLPVPVGMTPEAKIEQVREAMRVARELRKRAETGPLSVYTRDAVMSLRRTSCRFPLGAFGTPSFHFCCEPQVVGSSYCAEHRALCVVSVPARSDADGARN